MANRNKRTKLKTHKSAAKRLSVSGSGKLLRSFGSRGRRTKKRDQVRNMIGEQVPVDSGYEPRLRRMIPYGVE